MPDFDQKIKKITKFEGYRKHMSGIYRTLSFVTAKVLSSQILVQ